MKLKITTFLAFAISTNFAMAQCTPDAYTGNHSFILPDSSSFPHAQVGAAFSATIKIQVAHDTTGTFDVPQVGPTAGTFAFDSVTIQSVTTSPALPSGVTLSYTCNPANCKFLGASTGCINVSVSAITATGIYRIYVATVAKGTFTPAALPFPLANQSIAQTVDRYRIIVDPAGTFIDENSSDNNSLNILEMLPNPANNNVSIAYYDDENASINFELFSAIGSKIISEKTSSRKGVNKKIVDVSNLANGFYFIKISSNGKSSVKKLLVSH